MKEIQVGKVMLTFKGEYDSTKTYTRLDAVTYQGSSYVCLADTSTTPPSDSWQVLAEKGATGDTGKTGDPGKQGNPGANGVSPHIDKATGHWFVGSSDTGVSAQGPQGEQGSPGKDGVTPDVSKLATKTDLSNYYTKPETDSAINSSIDKIQIGGRNLVVGSDQDFVADDTANTKTQGWCFRMIDLTQEFKVGDQVTVSAEGTLTGKGDLSTYDVILYSADTGANRSNAKRLKAGTRSSATLTVTNLNGKGATKLLIYAGNISDTEGKKNTIHHLKVERGNKATDWTPAPEDFDTKLSTKADKSQLPDMSKYAQTSDIPSLSGYAKLSDIPSVSGFLKQADLAGYVKTGDLASYAKLSDLPAPVDTSSFATNTALSSVRTTAQSASNAASSAQSTAQVAQDTANNAESRAESAYSLASTASSDAKAATQVPVITSGTLADLANKQGVYHYEIDFIPSDSPTQDGGLLDVVVGTNQAKQVFTNTANADVYVRTRKSESWSEWRQITLWN